VSPVRSRHECKIFTIINSLTLKIIFIEDNNMETYGWNIYRKEGLQELLRIKESPTLGDKEAQISFLETYYQIYKNEKEDQIKATTFYSPKTGKGEAQKKASDVIQRLRQSIEKFYESEEGKKSLYEIYFVAESRDYRLGVRPIKNKEQTENKDDGMSYIENKYFITPLRPFIIQILSVILLLVSPFLIFISAIVIYLERTHSSWLILFAGYGGLILSFFLLHTGMMFNKLLDRRLVYFYAKYFLRIITQDVALVSYSGKCSVPECKGNVFLSNEYKKGTGYIAKCSDYPDGHRYSIDPTTCKGDRIIF
jgi:hypothetical protein